MLERSKENIKTMGGRMYNILILIIGGLLVIGGLWAMHKQDIQNAYNVGLREGCDDGTDAMMEHKHGEP